MLNIFVLVCKILTIIFNGNNINNNVVHDFLFFLLLYSLLLHHNVHFKSYQCHDIKQPMTYHVVEFYVTTIVASLLLNYDCKQAPV